MIINYKTKHFLFVTNPFNYSATFIMLSILLWPLGVVQAQELLFLTFAEGPTDTGKIYSTETIAQAPTLSVVEGQQVIWKKSRGRDYQLQAAPQSWTWTQVQQVAREETYIAVTTRSEGEKVSVEVNYFNREGEQSMSYNSTVYGVMGQWIPLLQPTTSPQADGKKVYTVGNSTQQLSLKVEPGIK